MGKLTHNSILVGTLLFGILSGCESSPSPRLYMIEPMTMMGSANSVAGLTIAVGPITLPEHLNRKEILTHDEPYRVSTATFDRWAEPLDQDITAALAENLSILVPTDRVITYPFDNALQVDYTVNVRVFSFGAGPNGEVELKSSWVIYDTANAPATCSKARYSEQRRGSEVVDTVAAMSRAIEQLSRDIADAINKASTKSKQY